MQRSDDIRSIYNISESLEKSKDSLRTNRVFLPPCQLCWRQAKFWGMRFDLEVVGIET